MNAHPSASRSIQTVIRPVAITATVSVVLLFVLFVLGGRLSARAEALDSATQARMQAAIQPYSLQLARLQSQVEAQARVSSDYAFSSGLALGSTGSAVSELQRFLATDPTLYPEGLVTGYYGPLTMSAVQRFQCRQNIVCDGSIETTGYGRVGPITFAELAVVAGQTGVGGPIEDRYAPIMSFETIATSSNSATVSWMTNEPARSRIFYSTVFPFNYDFAASASDSAPFDLIQEVRATGLLTNTTYFYARESVDLSGNVQFSTARSFRTGQ